MAKYYMHGNTMLRESYDYRVALPIIAAAIFCFGFVLISSLDHHSNALASKSKRAQTLQVKSTKVLDAQGQLNTLAPSATTTNLNTSSSAAATSSTATSASGSSTTATGSSTTSPETSNSSSSVLNTIKTADPQSSSSAQQSNLQLAPSTTTVPSSGTSGTSIGKGVNTTLQATKSNTTNVLNEIL
jgi:hypothetical protein